MASRLFDFMKIRKPEITLSKQQNDKRFSMRMQKKLAVLFALILVAFLTLSVRLFAINRDNGEKYKKQVLSQQEYDSVTLIAKRGDILDKNGSKLAVSQKVYNVILDAKKLNSSDGEFLEPTLQAIYSTGISFLYTKEELRDFIRQNPSSQYRVIAKKQSFDVTSPLMDMLNNPAEYPDIKGIWLEDNYQRQYPYNSLACDVVGFVQGDNEGIYGLEEYYNDSLNGTNGREYGYLNDDENLERTIKPAQDGNTIVTSLDVNIQSIVEKHILAFNEQYRDAFREGNGSSNTGVIVMNPNTGEVLAMASYPVFDLNNPRDTNGLKVEMPQMTVKDANDPDDPEAEENAETQETQETEETPQTEEGAENAGTATMMVSPMTDPSLMGEAYEEAFEQAKMEALNALWKNFCINSTYEPGSTMKPFTMACGLEEGLLTGNENYRCEGVLNVGGHEIHCSNRLGHGDLTFSGALENSCNVAFMKIGATIGRSTFMKYNKIFNFGLKTNIDLAGESRTDTLVFDESVMTPTDLAVGSFGQGFNTTMIQMITGFCSLINGGYYYQPHLVTKILNSEGATIRAVEPRILKQTISAETSEKIRELCVNVVALGTGRSARPAGYMIGGKTGTAEKLPRGNGNYLVSFIGFAPADDPQIVIYTVIDEPNAKEQASAKFATVLTRDILTEVLPYLNVFQTEELSEEEATELAEKQLLFSNGSTLEEETEEETPEAEENAEGEAAENADTEEENKEEETERKIQFDPETGYAIDPTTGDLLDPETGRPIDSNVSDLADVTTSPITFVDEE
ncbi:MAG: cell division protein FtsI [Lachnospiraceae bacterium]|nr:cell division protein FtsI [Lachnospiraceae bacterium]